MDRLVIPIWSPSDTLDLREALRGQEVHVPVETQTPDNEGQNRD